MFISKKSYLFLPVLFFYLYSVNASVYFSHFLPEITENIANNLTLKDIGRLLLLNKLHFIFFDNILTKKFIFAAVLDDLFNGSYTINYPTTLKFIPDRDSFFARGYKKKLLDLLPSKDMWKSFCDKRLENKTTYKNFYFHFYTRQFNDFYPSIFNFIGYPVSLEKNHNQQSSAVIILQENGDNKSATCTKHITFKPPCYEKRKENVFPSFSFLFYRGTAICEIAPLFIEANKKQATLIIEKFTIKELLNNQDIITAINNYPSVVLLDKKGKTIWYAENISELELIRKFQRA